MMNTGETPVKKSRNMIAKDLRTPKYRLRVVISKKTYKRNKKVNQHD
jgi:hypothetical protein